MKNFDGAYKNQIFTISVSVFYAMFSKNFPLPIEARYFLKRFYVLSIMLVRLIP